MNFARFKIDPIDAIVAVPIPRTDIERKRAISVTAGSIKESTEAMKGASYETYYSYENVSVRIVYCEEHRTMEFVPSVNYRGDLEHWYAVGLHPRFSIFKALYTKGKQILSEAQWRVVEIRRWEPAAFRAARKAFLPILKNSRTPEEFLKNVADRLFVNLYFRRRRYRVRAGFKKKFLARSFTTGDFFAERNQERRRLMFRRGVEPKDVMRRMRAIAEDDEGKLYEIRRDRRGFDNARYLYVKCPSTGQEYFLEVPSRFEKPAEARRWTFDLPAEAKFVAEA